MPHNSLRAGEAAPLSAVGVLDRREAVPKLIGDPNDFLIIAALAGTAKDTAHLCEPNANYYACAGVMGGATAMGLGLALAQPTRRVLVMAGDGDLLMNVGTLATVAIMNPPNLSIVCVDNGHYGETGYQKSHTALGVDLAAMAVGAGIKAVCTVSRILTSPPPPRSSGTWTVRRSCSSRSSRLTRQKFAGRWMPPGPSTVFGRPSSAPVSTASGCCARCCARLMVPRHTGGGN